MQPFQILIEFTINLIQGLLFAYFAFRMCKVKSKYDKKLSRTLIFAAITLAVSLSITISDYIVFYEGIAIFLYGLAGFCVVFPFMDAPITKKIFISVIPVNAMAVGAIVPTNVATYIVNKPIYEFMSEMSLVRYCTIFSTQILYFIVVFSVSYIYRKHNANLKNSEWILLSVISALSVIGYMFILNSILNSTSILSNFYCALAAAIVLTINIAMFSMLVRYGARSKVEIENGMLKQQLSFQSDTISETKKQYENLQKMRHDFKNNILIIESMAAEGKTSDIINYINDLNNNQIEFSSVINTNNSFINALINAKAVDAKNNGIEFEIMVCGDFSNINSFDVCTVIGNALDNAIEASSLSKNKTVRLTVERDNTNNNLNITVKNSVDTPVLIDNLNLTSTKEDSRSHGYGTKIIREITERNEGFVDFYDENGMFCVHIEMATVVIDHSNN